MSSSQISVAVDQWLRDRLRISAARQNMTVSELVRVFIRDGLDRPNEPQVVLSYETLEEIMIAIFDSEELIVRMYMEPSRPQKPDEKMRRKIVGAAEGRARKKVTELLGPKAESQQQPTATSDSLK